MFPKIQINLLVGHLKKDGNKRGTNVGYDLKKEPRGERRKMEDGETSKKLLFRDTINEILVELIKQLKSIHTATVQRSTGLEIH